MTNTKQDAICMPLSGVGKLQRAGKNLWDLYQNTQINQDHIPPFRDSWPGT